MNRSPESRTGVHARHWPPLGASPVAIHLAVRCEEHV